MEAMSDELPGQAGERVGVRSWREMFLDLARGKARALEEIYEAAAGGIFGLALWRTGSREDACDVVQEVFVRLVEQGERLRRVRNPRAWILTVAHRVAVDATRRRRRSEPMESCRFLESTPGNTDRELDAGKASSLLARLPPAQREAVYLRHFADCTFAEIGRVTGVPTFTAASRHRLGISRLRELMGGKR
jgi:RNA polymerase sigma-70 factor (ECF subfamily)